MFDATRFVNDYDYGMELILEVDGSAAGYRSFYIPWALVEQGKVLRYYMTLLTGPESEDTADNRTRREKEAEAIRAYAEGKIKPYVLFQSSQQLCFTVNASRCIWLETPLQLRRLELHFCVDFP